MPDITVFGRTVTGNGFFAVTLTGVGGAAQLVTVTLLFILVLALTYFTTRFVGSYQKKQLSGSNIQIFETMRLSANKLIQIVKVGDKYFAVAVCKDTVTLLGEVNGGSLSIKEPELSGNSDFAAILNKFRRKDGGQQEDKPQKGSREDR